METAAEVQELRNKLRMMKFPQDEILNTVRKQQRAISKQKQANDTIRIEITEYETQIEAMQAQIEMHQANEELQHLQALHKNLANKYSVITADLAAEEAKRRKLEEEVSRANSRSGGLFKQSRENEVLQGRLRTMENRLDKALVRYNRNLGELSDVRARLDELRKDRHNFQGAMAGSQASLAAKDETMGSLIKSSNDAYAQRDKKKMKLAEVRSAEKADVQAYEVELRNVNDKVAAQKLTQNRPVDHHPVEPHSDVQAGSQSEQQEELTALTEQYNTTIQRTLELCAIPTLPELFVEAEKLERENFSLYNYVVEHGAKLTRLQEEIEGLELQYDTLVAQTSANDQRQSGLLEKLTAKIQKVDSDLTSSRDLKEANDAEFASAYTEIEAIFNTLECKWDDSPDGKTTVTPVNAMFCLCAIEAVIADQISATFDKTRLECNLKDIKPSTFLPEPSETHAPAKTAQTRASDKENAVKFTDAAKPLSIEELRALLE
jgi:chromosome segregation ATPase